MAAGEASLVTHCSLPCQLRLFKGYDQSMFQTMLINTIKPIMTLLYAYIVLVFCCGYMHYLRLDILGENTVTTFWLIIISIAHFYLTGQNYLPLAYRNGGEGMLVSGGGGRVYFYPNHQYFPLFGEGDGRGGDLLRSGSF